MAATYQDELRGTFAELQSEAASVRKLVFDPVALARRLVVVLEERDDPLALARATELRDHLEAGSVSQAAVSPEMKESEDDELRGWMSGVENKLDKLEKRWNNPASLVRRLAWLMGVRTVPRKDAMSPEMAAEILRKYEDWQAAETDPLAVARHLVRLLEAART